ncbi:RING-H2 finger protein ATL39-like [Miscanthus floridulus]|uniref:RING-H2 finger protein ATL39-like n=1 Tax=Miscanthus floridulus TaxID=154761 RepID=UPI0034599F0D
MSSNGTASPGAGGGTRCCKATTLVAVAATSFVCCFILVVAFLFVRFLLLRQRWHPRARRLLQEQHHRSKPGLDAAVIALIPPFPYLRQADAEAEGSTSVPAAATECVVCLGVLDEGQMVRQLPGCKHVFHQECIDVWLASRASCPVCRGKAEPPAPARAEDRAAAASTPARVAAVDMFGDEERTSSSTPRGSRG